ISQFVSELPPACSFASPILFRLMTGRPSRHPSKTLPHPPQDRHIMPPIFSRFLPGFGGQLLGPAHGRTRTQRRPARIRLESLEDRTLLAVDFKTVVAPA